MHFMQDGSIAFENNVSLLIHYCFCNNLY